MDDVSPDVPQYLARPTTVPNSPAPLDTSIPYTSMSYLDFLAPLTVPNSPLLPTQAPTAPQAIEESRHNATGVNVTHGAGGATYAFDAADGVKWDRYTLVKDQKSPSQIDVMDGDHLVGKLGSKSPGSAPELLQTFVTGSQKTALETATSEWTKTIQGHSDSTLAARTGVPEGQQEPLTAETMNHLAQLPRANEMIAQVAKLDPSHAQTIIANAFDLTPGQAEAVLAKAKAEQAAQPAHSAGGHTAAASTAAATDHISSTTSQHATPSATVTGAGATATATATAQFTPIQTVDAPISHTLNLSQPSGGAAAPPAHGAAAGGNTPVWEKQDTFTATTHGLVVHEVGVSNKGTTITSDTLIDNKGHVHVGDITVQQQGHAAHTYAADDPAAHNLRNVVKQSVERATLDNVAQVAALKPVEEPHGTGFKDLGHNLKEAVLGPQQFMGQSAGSRLLGSMSDGLNETIDRAGGHGYAPSASPPDAPNAFSVATSRNGGSSQGSIATVRPQNTLIIPDANGKVTPAEPNANGRLSFPTFCQSDVQGHFAACAATNTESLNPAHTYQRELMGHNNLKSVNSGTNAKLGSYIQQQQANFKQAQDNRRQAAAMARAAQLQREGKTGHAEHAAAMKEAGLNVRGQVHH